MKKAISLYLIGNLDYRCWKIGITRNLPERIKQIQSGIPFSVGVFDCYEMPDWETAKRFERQLHGRYASARLRGEWFDQVDAVDFRVSAEGLLLHGGI